MLDPEIELGDDAGRSRPTRARTAERSAVAGAGEVAPVGIEVLSDARFEAPSALTPGRPFRAAERSSDFLEDRASRGSAYGGVPGRRTVTIRGRGAERDLAFPAPGTARRPAVRRHERPGFKPDRAGLWAVLLGLLLVLVAAASAHGAVPAHARTVPAARVIRLAPPAATGVLHVSPAHVAGRVIAP